MLKSASDLEAIGQPLARTLITDTMWFDADRALELVEFLLALDAESESQQFRTDLRRALQTAEALWRSEQLREASNA